MLAPPSNHLQIYQIYKVVLAKLVNPVSPGFIVDEKHHDTCICDIPHIIMIHIFLYITKPFYIYMIIYYIYIYNYIQNICIYIYNMIHVNTHYIEYNSQG